MLVTSLTCKGEELLEQRATPAQWREEGKTTGVPLLYPWANRLERDDAEVAGETLDTSAAKHDENGLAKDGLPTARGAWTVRAQFPDHVRGELDWTSEPGFPFSHRISLTHALDPEGLTVTVRVDGHGPPGVPISFGWHPYIKIDRAHDVLTIPAARPPPARRAGPAHRSDGRGTAARRIARRRRNRRALRRAQPAVTRRSRDHAHRRGLFLRAGLVPTRSPLPGPARTCSTCARRCAWKRRGASPARAGWPSATARGGSRAGACAAPPRRGPRPS